MTRKDFIILAEIVATWPDAEQKNIARLTVGLTERFANFRGGKFWETIWESRAKATLASQEAQDNAAMEAEE